MGEVRRKNLDPQPLLGEVLPVCLAGGGEQFGPPRPRRVSAQCGQARTSRVGEC